MNRTDVHSPSNLVTEDYEYAYCYDGHPEEGDRRFAVEALNRLLDEGYRFGQVHGGDTCDHCGARLRYVAVLKHLPTMTLIKVGETCLDNRFSLASIEFHTLRKAAKLNRERKARTEKVAAFLSVAKNRAAFEFCEDSLAEGDHGYNGMRFDFVHKVNRYGDVSEKFVDAIIRDIVRTEKWEARKAEEALTATDAPEGKVVVTGEVQSVKFHDNAFGGALKMTVRDDAGFKVWVTVPAALDNVEKGDRVTFTATLTPSDRDSTFSFGKRPSKASFLTQKDVEA